MDVVRVADGSGSSSVAFRYIFERFLEEKFRYEFHCEALPNRLTKWPAPEVTA